MLEKSPPQDSITAFSGDKITFMVEYDGYREYHIYHSINGEQRVNAPLGGEAFPVSYQFEPGVYNVLIVVSESNKTSGKADTTRSRSLEDGGVHFEWTVRVVPTKVLYDSKAEKAVGIIQNVLMLYTLGTLGKEAIERIEKYYDSLSQAEQADLREQTKMSEYIDESK